GRIKGAIGIGSLLLDGLGDTIRVSLTEDSVYEIPVARAIADKAMSLWHPDSDLRSSAPSAAPRDSIDPYHFAKRETATLAFSDACVVGPEQPPRVIVRVPSVAAIPAAARDLASPKLKDTPPEGLLVPLTSAGDLAALCEVAASTPLPVAFLALELAPALTPDLLQPLLALSRGRLLLVRRFDAGDDDSLRAFADQVRRHRHFLAAELTPSAAAALAPTLRSLGDEHLLISLSAPFSAPGASPSAHATGAYRQLTETLRTAGSRAPIWIRNTSATAVRGDHSFLSKLLEASFLTGGLLCDGVGDIVSIETEADVTRATKLAYNVLQGAGARISKTEFVACPSCGRTLFDLQTTTQRIRAQTGHLKGVKLAIMGCIVNGPGEMADADFGYVGGAPGKINLYVGKNCVQYNIPQAEADARLIALIKEHGKWIEPELAPA
ncbi:MAG: flavodoxin-dependent (E)-4-hydroxy-3-methylbut-2-enyl-diphosphate synthase, partial [Verrucomicrobia bacterium]|nr:flavodoxin-dependent (E)-4-hydroxy-3-methylbut-2-enyl-diphosphate synthase [Verrucomicrobiota bacterium]